MSLIETMNADIKAAMLAKEQTKLEALRAIKSALLVAQTSGEAVTPAVEIKILQKLARQRKEAAEIYTAENRTELANDELALLAVIEKYLPASMSEDEIALVIDRIIKETGTSSIKDMGKLMGLASKELAGKADNKVISNIIKQKLS